MPFARWALLCFYALAASRVSVWLWMQRPGQGSPALGISGISGRAVPRMSSLAHHA